MLRRTYFIAVTLLLGLLSFVVTASAAASLTLLWALVIGGLSFSFTKLISQGGEPASDIASMLMAGTIVALGGGLKWLAGSAAGWQDSIAILISLGAAWGLDLLFAGGAQGPCFICKLPIAERVPFACPRCHQSICTRPSCWIARRFRCTLCDERDVIIFPTDEQWWRARVGARVSEGSCNSCYKEASETDLRACDRCRWTMCRRCWDYQNGQCSHCQWTMPDLPASLTPFLGTAPSVAARSTAATRRHS